MKVETWKSKIVVGQDHKPLIIRSHVYLSPKSKDALEYWIDQKIWRTEEWSRRGGDQALAEHIVEGHKLDGEDLAAFIAELKTRKAGLDYTILHNIHMTPGGGHKIR